ncbi:MAG TPA: CcoQ/FixQ family Cbb3-type cytochrome c oxidase assembly chaperone [Nevskiaceae bacterium]|nr:CcoQ/FixQ family Cbb3-type cytochrome c oxidase assembly chaperone [Nevskiaceae bacterium]
MINGIVIVLVMSALGALTWWAWSPRRKSSFEQHARVALHDEPGAELPPCCKGERT